MNVYKNIGGVKHLVLKKKMKHFAVKIVIIATILNFNTVFIKIVQVNFNI